MDISVHLYISIWPYGSIQASGGILLFCGEVACNSIKAHDNALTVQCPHSVDVGLWLTVSAEGTGECEGVGNVVCRHLLLDQRDQRPVSHLQEENASMSHCTHITNCYLS